MLSPRRPPRYDAGMKDELQQAVDDPTGRASLAIREVERLVNDDIRTAERGLDHYSRAGNVHMQELLRAEKKLLECSGTSPRRFRRSRDEHVTLLPGRPPACRLSSSPRPSFSRSRGLAAEVAASRCGMAQEQRDGLITRRSPVRIRLPLPPKTRRGPRAISSAKAGVRRSAGPSALSGS